MDGYPVIAKSPSHVVALGAVLALLIVLCACRKGSAEGNPVFERILVKYWDTEYENGPAHVFTVTQHLVAYDPDLSGWCEADHKTSAGQKYHHAHTAHGFPFTDTDRNKEVTATMSDWWWNYEMNPQGSPGGWQLMEGSSSTMSSNCHGFSMGRNLWIAHGGSNTVISDEYTHITSPKKNCIAWWHAPTTDHSYKVLDVKVLAKPPASCDGETHLQQKVLAGGVYEWEAQEGQWMWLSMDCWYEKK